MERRMLLALFLFLHFPKLPGPELRVATIEKKLFYSFLFCPPGLYKSNHWKKTNKWFPWAFWWNLFEFFCNGDLPMTFARPRFARRSLGGASLRSVAASLRSAGRPRFAPGGASLRSAGGPLKTVPPRANPPGDCTRKSVPHRSVTHGPLVWFHQKEKLGCRLGEEIGVRKVAQTDSCSHECKYKYTEYRSICGLF